MRNIIVTGGNRGLGEGVASHFLQVGENVCVTVRSSLGAEMVHAWHERLMQNHPSLGKLTIVHWDANHPEHIQPEFEHLLRICDVLVNNAGWEADLGIPCAPGQDHNILFQESEILMKALQINANAPRVLMGKVIEGMVSREYGRIVNVASARAKVVERVGDNNTPAYRLSKGALVLVTKEAAHEWAVPNIKINALCPGWCKTRMGGQQAPEDVSFGVQRIVEICNLPNDGPTGQFWSDGVVSPLA